MILVQTGDRIQITTSSSSYSLENQLRAVESLGGNSQLYLVMQDMSSPRFLVKLSQAMPTSKSIRYGPYHTITTPWPIKNTDQVVTSVDHPPTTSKIPRLWPKMNFQSKMLIVSELWLSSLMKNGIFVICDHLNHLINQSLMKPISKKTSEECLLLSKAPVDLTDNHVFLVRMTSFKWRHNFKFWPILF